MSNRTLRDLLRGRGAHADPLASIADLSPELAGRRLPGVDQTIWQLDWHMNYWMDYELQSLAGPEVPYPERADVSWPATDAPPSTEAWDALVTTTLDLTATKKPTRKNVSCRQAQVLQRVS